MHDLLNPVKHDRIDRIINEQTDIHVVHDWVEQHAVVLYNATNNDELRGIAENLNKNPSMSLLGGCAGFAKFLPVVFGIAENSLMKVQLTGPMVIISGSTSSVSFKQLRYYERHGFRSVVFHDVLEAEPDFDGIISSIQDFQGQGGVLLRLRVPPRKWQA